MDAYLETNREYHDERDRAALQACAIPEGEEVGVRCVWVIEAYLASHVGLLTERLQRLDLTGDRPTGYDPIELLRQARRHGSGPASSGLGFLVPNPQRARHGGDMYVAPLPAGVELVYLKLHNPLPSLTLVTAQFRFDEDTARAIETPLRTMFHSMARDRGRYVELPSGEELRREAVAEYREMLRRRCTNWMREHLPGAFARLEPWEPTPTAELVTLAIADPLLGWPPPTTTQPEASPTPPAAPEASETHEAPYRRARRAQRADALVEDYLDVMGLSDDWDAWASPDMPGLTLRLPPRQAAHDHLVLAVCVKDFETDDHLAGYGGRTPAGVTSRLVHLSHTLGVFAIERLVRAYEARLSGIRDRLGDVAIDRTGRALRQLQRLERDLAVLARDARPLLADLITTAPDQPFAWDLFTFLPLSPRDRQFEQGATLFTGMLERLVERAKRALSAEAETGRTLQSMSGLTVARSTLRLQRVAVALAVIAAVLAALAVPILTRWVAQYLEP